MKDSGEEWKAKVELRAERVEGEPWGRTGDVGAI